MFKYNEKKDNNNNQKLSSDSSPISLDNYNVWEYIRVVNVRGEADFVAQRDETVITAHRANPVLGNKHVMKNKSMSERERVIASYKADLNKDIEDKGPMWNVLQNISKDMIEKKQKIAFQCFCAPLNCHANLLVPVLAEMVLKRLKNEERLQENIIFKSSGIKIKN